MKIISAPKSILFISFCLQLTIAPAMARDKDKELISELKAALGNLAKQGELKDQSTSVIKQVEVLKKQQDELLKSVAPDQAKLLELDAEKSQRQSAYTAFKNSEYNKEDIKKLCSSSGCDSTNLEKLIDVQQQACGSVKNRGIFNSQDCRQAQNKLKKGLDTLESHEVGLIEKDMASVNKMIGEVQTDIADQTKEINQLETKRAELEKLMADSPEQKQVVNILDEITGNSEEVVIDQKLLLLDAKNLKNELGIEASNASKLVDDIATKYEGKMDDSVLGAYIHKEIGQALTTSEACDAVKLCMVGATPDEAQINDLSRDKKEIIQKLEMKKANKVESSKQ